VKVGAPLPVYGDSQPHFTTMAGFFASIGGDIARIIGLVRKRRDGAGAGAKNG